MKCVSVLGVALAAGMVSAPNMAASATQPPMNDFNEAFYTCDNGGAFLISYDGTSPGAATMTTSNNNKTYMLKRASAPTGVQFTGGAVKFWTDGSTVTVEGTDQPYLNCKIKKG